MKAILIARFSTEEQKERAIGCQLKSLAKNIVKAKDLKAFRAAT